MTTTVSLDELKKHRRRDDVWIAIHGKVYNVTDFLDKHPGGVEVLLEQAGMDATGAFEDIGHSDYARELMEQYEMAKLAEAGSDNLAVGAKEAAPRASSSVSPPRKAVCDLVPKSVMYCTTATPLYYRCPIVSKLFRIAVAIGACAVAAGFLACHYSR